MWPTNIIFLLFSMTYCLLNQNISFTLHCLKESCLLNMIFFSYCNTNLLCNIKHINLIMLRVHNLIMLGVHNIHQLLQLDFLMLIKPVRYIETAISVSAICIPTEPWYYCDNRVKPLPNSLHTQLIKTVTWAKNRLLLC